MKQDIVVVTGFFLSYIVVGFIVHTSRFTIQQVLARLGRKGIGKEEKALDDVLDFNH